MLLIFTCVVNMFTFSVHVVSYNNTRGKQVFSIFSVSHVHLYSSGRCVVFVHTYVVSGVSVLPLNYIPNGRSILSRIE